MDPSPSSSSPSPSPSPASITITVKTTSGTSVAMQICPATETVSDLKSRLASELNIFADQQQLVFAGRQLTSGLLSQYNLRAGSTVTLALAMHSGPLYAAKRTSLFGKQDLSAILRTLTEEQIAFLLSQKRPVTVTTKVGDQLVVFTLMPSDIDPSVDSEDPETPTAASAVEQLPAAAAAAASHSDPASVQTASFPVTSKPLPVPKQKSPVMAAAETTTAAPSDAEPTAAPEFSTLMVNERDAAERQERRRHHHHHHHHHRSSSRRSCSSSSSSSSSCTSSSCSSSSSSSSSPSSTAHMSSQERLKEHRRRREAHREAHREQKRKNEALRIKVAFLLEQLREKSLSQEEVTEQPQPQPQPLTWVSVEPMEMSQMDEEVFTEPSTPAPEPAVSEQPASPAPEASLASGSANRCFKCSKKLGLATTFKCKCDHNFCAAHRWESSSPDSKDGHCCSFDFKSHGRQLLRDSNPLVKSTRVQSL